MTLKTTIFTIPAFFLLVFSAGIVAELRIEVTKGLDNAVRVAIVPFELRGRGVLPEDPAAIVASDLQLSGRFDLLPVDSMLSLPHAAVQVFFSRLEITENRVSGDWQFGFAASFDC